MGRIEAHLDTQPALTGHQETAEILADDDLGHSACQELVELVLAWSRDGQVRGQRGRLIPGIGAYAGSGTGQPGIIVGHMISAYVLPARDIAQQLVYTNTAPAGFIRGGGRPLR